MGWRGLFGAGKVERKAEADRIKRLARPYLAGGSCLSVNEILCLNPACPDLETVILVMREGAKTRAYKVQKPMAEVTEQDLAQAFVPEEGPTS